MKNWIITLFILVVPLSLYFALKDNQKINSEYIAEATNQPSVIKFSSPMCADCKKIKAEIAPLIPIYKDKVNFVDINATSTDRATQEKIDQYGVTVVPTLIFTNPIKSTNKKIEGFIPKKEIEQHIKEIING